MSEKIYAFLLQLLAPQFHNAYGREAARLVADRCRDERGVVGKIRLWGDLLGDLALTAIRDVGFGRQIVASQLALADAPQASPSFTALTGGLPTTSALLTGGAFSLCILAVLSALISFGGQSQTAAPRSVHSASGSLMFVPAAVVDANEKKRVLNGVIANLRESYVYPNVAQKMIDALLTHERNGDYNSETTGEDFAALLTKHLQDVSHDLHLRVAYSETEVAPLGPPEADANFQRMIKRDNCAFRKVEVLSDNIGYLKFDAFGPVSLCGDTAAAALRFLPHVDALIFDLRENQGGDPHMVSFIASHLFDRRTHLNDIYSQLDKSTEQFWTLANLPGPKFGSQPVYVLTSADTFSGAEEFAYDLKHLKRAVIVGETTAGGAHLVMNHRVGNHFIVGVPFARPINPISKTDWEGIGVAPDVKVQSSDAFEVAQQLARDKLEHKQE